MYMHVYICIYILIIHVYTYNYEFDMYIGIHVFIMNMCIDYDTLYVIACRSVYAYTQICGNFHKFLTV